MIQTIRELEQGISNRRGLKEKKKRGNSEHLLTYLITCFNMHREIVVSEPKEKLVKV